MFDISFDFVKFGSQIIKDTPAAGQSWRIGQRVECFVASLRPEKGSPVTF